MNGKDQDTPGPCRERNLQDCLEDLEKIVHMQLVFQGDLASTLSLLKGEEHPSRDQGLNRVRPGGLVPSAIALLAQLEEVLHENHQLHNRIRHALCENDLRGAPSEPAGPAMGKLAYPTRRG